MNAGVKIFEAALGGLGGCPFTKVAGGNVCTEDLVHYWQRTGLRTDLKLAELIAAAQDLALHLGRDLPGMVYKSGPLNYVATL
jgi:hydroxymethylglutaryl-CoA lyase